MDRMEDRLRHQDSTGSTITDSIHDIPSDRLDIILDSLLDDTVIIHLRQNGMTILGVCIKRIQFLDTGIATMRTKAIYKNSCQVIQDSTLNLMEHFSRNHTREVSNLLLALPSMIFILNDKRSQIVYLLISYVSLVVTHKK